MATYVRHALVILQVSGRFYFYDYLIFFRSGSATCERVHSGKSYHHIYFRRQAIMRALLHFGEITGTWRRVRFATSEYKKFNDLFSTMNIIALF